MVEHTEGDPMDDGKGVSAKAVLDTAMSAIQFLLVLMAVVTLVITGISLQFSIELMVRVAGGGIVGAILIQVIYFNWIGR